MAVNPVKASTDLRLAELMTAISLATDIADGYPLEKSLKDALLAIELARELALDGQDLSDVYYTALLAHLGCTAQSFDLAAGFGGDDIGIRRVQLTGDPQIIRKAFRASAKQMSPLEVTAIMARIAMGGRRLFQSNTDATCEAADRLAIRLDMSNGVRRALLHVYT